MNNNKVFCIIERLRKFKFLCLWQYSSWIIKRVAYRYYYNRFPDRALITKIDRDIKLRIWPGDIIGEPIYVKGVFEETETWFIKKFIKSSKIFFDIGANIGYYSFLAAKYMGPSSQVHSFEPNPRMFTELQYNITLNGLNNIFPNQLALADKTGTGHLSHYEKGKEVFCSLSQRVFPGVVATGFDEIKISTLDEYVYNNRVKQLDIMKIDVEGAELKVFQGAREVLKKAGALIIVFELTKVNVAGFGHSCEDVLSFLHDLNYITYMLIDKNKIIEIGINNSADFSGKYSFIASKQKLNFKKS
jgi:FkbM family methyltransferase